LPAFPAYIEEASDDEEPFDIETESEVETEETEGLADDAPVSEASDGENRCGWPKRKRRRRRRGRPGEARDGGPARDESEIPQSCLRPQGLPAWSATRANPTRTKARSSRGWFARIRAQAASEGRGVADVVAAAAGAAGRKMVWPDRLRTKLGRPGLGSDRCGCRFRRIFGRAVLAGRSAESIAPPPERQYVDHGQADHVQQDQQEAVRPSLHETPRKRPKEPRGAAQPCAKR